MPKRPMVEVLMRTRYAGIAGVCRPGGRIMLDKAEAAGIVKGGYGSFADEGKTAPKMKKAPPAGKGTPENVGQEVSEDM